MTGATSNKIIKNTGLILLLAPIALLWWAAAKAGLFYLLDHDELAHVQMSFLIFSGFRPYADFFTIYPPVFHWFAALIMNFAGGGSTEIFQVLRYVMVILFTFRLALIYFIADRLFGRLTGLLTILLYLVDPLNIFSAMQIRPDNLMLTFFLLSVATALSLPGKKTSLAVMLQAFFLAASVLTLPKIIPGAAAIFLSIILYLYFSAKKQLISVYLLTLLLSGLIFLLPFFAGGTLANMIQNTVFDPILTNNTLLYPVKLGSFYHNDNNYWMYGQGARPATWQYILTLPLVAFAGLGSAVTLALQRRKLQLSDYILLAIAGTLILQWASLMFINSVFIQYYIPITWLYAVFAANGLIAFGKLISERKILLTIYSLGTITLLAIVARTAFYGNLNRAKITDTNLLPDINNALSIIPPGEKTFGNVMFRPNAYPLPYGYYYGDIPKEITSRWRPVREYLEKDRLPYFIGGEYLLKALPPEDQVYIRNNYTQDPKRGDLWVRNN